MIQILRRIGPPTHSISKPLVDYKQRGQFRSPLELNVGEVVHDFEVTRRCKLPDFEIDLAVFRCRQSGTQWVHFDCEEERNTMAFLIKCSHAPHAVKLALQKMLQCGSKKYPVRNPIEFMTLRSFNPQNFSEVTKDYILYAYQTPLLADHKNLMSVFQYMMFDPLFRKEDFLETVWRYQLEGPKILQLKGVLAQQIKQSNYYSQTKIYTAIERNLLGNDGVCSTSDLTKLSYESAIEWYRKLFHPSNLLIISHGDMHPAKLMESYRATTKQFKFDQKPDLTLQDEKPSKKQFQSKTVKIQHLQSSVPLVISLKLQNLTATDRILLSILSYILFDMPNAVFMQWNTQATPYPKHYGYQDTHFNLGVTLLPKQKPYTDMEFLQEEKQIREALQHLYDNKIPNALIEQCLFHLEGQYYSRDGMKIISGCLETLLEEGVAGLEQSLNVKSFISKTLRNYRKDNLFEELLKKHIIDNPNYIRIVGKQNLSLVEDQQFGERVRLQLLASSMDEEQIRMIGEYKQADSLQDYRILPEIAVNQLEIFQEKDPLVFAINSVPIYYCPKCDGVKLTLRYDITDIDEEHMKLVPVICEAFPWMGGRGITQQALDAYTSMYVRNLAMNFETARTKDGMKMYLLLTVQFSDRNAQHGFNLATSLVNDHNGNNLEALSTRLQRKASQTYNDIVDNLVEHHGRHIGGYVSPYALFEDPIFMARSTCSIAADILKVANPKVPLEYLARQMSQITSKFKQQNRISVLFECKKQRLDRYRKYLQLMLNPLKAKATKLQFIDQKGFTPSPVLKYFPNYSQQFVFQAFPVPYYLNTQDVPATFVLSAIINRNIRRLNEAGGCFLFKGALVSYLRGSRKKAIELEGYYKEIDEIDQAKRYLFQQFRRYTAADLFHTGVSAEEVRNFKQAVAITSQSAVQAYLEKYILPSLKQGKSSVLAVGPHLGSYEPMIKKGWTIERSVEDMSLNMESEAASAPQLEMSKYLNIY